MSDKNNTTGLAMQAFDFEEAAVRVVVRDAQPWFVAKDVCEVLGIANSRDAVSALDEDEKMTVGITDSHSGKRGGARLQSLVSESGLYALIFKSRKAEAKRFRKWVTSEVIPAIRATGGYTVAAPAPSALEELREMLLSSARQVRDMKLDVGRAQQIANLAARYLESVKLEGEAIGYENVLGLRGGEGAGSVLPGKKVVQALPQPALPGVATADAWLPGEAEGGEGTLEGGEPGEGEDADAEGPGEADLR